MDIAGLDMTMIDTYIYIVSTILAPVSVVFIFNECHIKKYTINVS